MVSVTWPAADWVTAAAATLVGAMVSVATTDPGMVAVVLMGTVTLAVIVAGVVAVALCVDATCAQSSFWLWHSSTEKPGPCKETQAVN